MPTSPPTADLDSSESPCDDPTQLHKHPFSSTFSVPKMPQNRFIACGVSVDSESSGCHVDWGRNCWTCAIVNRRRPSVFASATLDRLGPDLPQLSDQGFLLVIKGLRKLIADDDKEVTPAGMLAAI